MKNLNKIVVAFIASMLLGACGTTSPTEPDEKYLFPELEQVDRISSYKIDGWGDIDRQSLFVTVSPSKSYLIILKRPNYDLPYAYGIKFNQRSSSIYAKFDSINIIMPSSELDPIPAYIERIYKLENREQKKMVRARIKGEEYVPPQTDEQES
ncbi:MAG: hypothetical protein HKN88_10450 [Gammaproteobacteria bacterium]|nr:hypothetical protein [Gammaproteobacteria bacterium]NNC98476.1 hypothetical protein [Gammaproteobacteria bacterium]NNM14783.1 hypothetical protein [Gammaproteobacteria bacterium]